MTPEELAEEVWRMLPSECKDNMKEVEESFKQSIISDAKYMAVQFAQEKFEIALQEGLNKLNNFKNKQQSLSEDFNELLNEMIDQQADSMLTDKRFTNDKNK